MTRTPYPVRPMSVGIAIGYIERDGRRHAIMPEPEFVRSFNNLLQRCGGATKDNVAQAIETASNAQVTAASAAVAAVEAAAAGAPSSYTLDPTQPISVVTTSAAEALVTIAAHTRTPTGMALINLDGGSVTIERGQSYMIYYNDPTDAGGAVTYFATLDPNVAADYAAGNRVVGPAYAAEYTNPFGSGGI